MLGGGLDGGLSRLGGAGLGEAEYEGDDGTCEDEQACDPKAQRGERLPCAILLAVLAVLAVSPFFSLLGRLQTGGATPPPQAPLVV